MPMDFDDILNESVSRERSRSPPASSERQSAPLARQQCSRTASVPPAQLAHLPIRAHQREQRQDDARRLRIAEAARELDEATRAMRAQRAAELERINCALNSAAECICRLLAVELTEARVRGIMDDVARSARAADADALCGVAARLELAARCSCGSPTAAKCVCAR